MIVPKLLPEKQPMFEKLKSFYYNQLYYRGLFVQQCEVFKRMATWDTSGGSNEYLKKLETETSFSGTISTTCKSCGQAGNVGQQCHYCLQLVLSCAVCRLPIRGLAFTCVKCNHVSHPDCIQRWFETGNACSDVVTSQTNCPWPGCDCYCTDE